MGAAELVYDYDGIQIWHGDNADVRPSPTDVGLVLTDPPYGMGYQHGARKGGARLGADGRTVIGDDVPFDPRWMLCHERLILWGGNHFADKLPPSPGWIIWDKRDGRPSNDQSDVEMAWSNVSNTARAYSQYWSGAVRGGRDQSIGKLHVSQKPVDLMVWLLERFTEPGDLVYDPYMGSGPIAQACADLGRRYIGVELEREYVDAAIGRLAQQTLALA